MSLPDSINQQGRKLQRGGTVHWRIETPYIIFFGYGYPKQRAQRIEEITSKALI